MKMCIFRYSFIERMIVLMCSKNACNKRTIKKQFSLINSFVYNDLPAKSCSSAENHHARGTQSLPYLI